MVAKAGPQYLDFGKRLTEALERAAISQRTAAKILRVSDEAIRLYCKGKRMPDDEKLAILAKLVGRPIAELRYGELATLSSLPKPVTVADEDELALLECYRKLPEWGKKALRARGNELLENFTPPSPANPYGKGRSTSQ